jgi:hypothetical protein
MIIYLRRSGEWRISCLQKKRALKTAEMSGKRAKMGCFPYRKQNSIAETRSTMESFLCYLDKIDATTGKSIKSRGFQLLKRFHVHPK